MPKPAAPNPLLNETRFEDHSVIVPPNRLKGAISRSGASNEVSMEPVQRAEAALKDIQKDFGGWMKEECDALEAARAAIHDGGADKARIERLISVTRDIRVNAALYGYPLAGNIADSLCRLVERASKEGAMPMKLIDAHVDAVRAVVREGLQGNDSRTGEEIYSRLVKLAKTEADELPTVDAPKL